MITTMTLWYIKYNNKSKASCFDLPTTMIIIFSTTALK